CAGMACNASVETAGERRWRRPAPSLRDWSLRSNLPPDRLALPALCLTCDHRRTTSRPADRHGDHSVQAVDFTPIAAANVKLDACQPRRVETGWAAFCPCTTGSTVILIVSSERNSTSRRR